MAKVQEFYKGRKKRRSYAIIPAAIILGIIAVAVVLFYAMQQYAVISKDSVEVIIPGFNEKETTIDAQGNVVQVFEKVDVDIIFDEPDYSNVQAVAGESVPEVRAIFVPAENLTQDKLNEYVARLNAGNGLVLEMKARNGVLMWNCNADEAYKYALSTPNQQTDALPGLIKSLREQRSDIYLVAQISCCIDELFANHSNSCTLKTSYGANYSDEMGYWLDPYNLNLRTYVEQMVRELWDMGFDEVLLADVMHPNLVGKEDAQLVYTRDMSTKPGAVNAVCGFALTVAQALEERPEGKYLSIYCYSRPALVRADESTGQDARLFMKLYDRVYLDSDGFAYSYNVADIESNIVMGNKYDRLVPVVINNLLDNSSWVLVDDLGEAEEDD